MRAALLLSAVFLASVAARADVQLLVLEPTTTRVVATDGTTGAPLRAELAGLCREYTTTLFTMGVDDVVRSDPAQPDSWRHIVVKGADGVARPHGFDDKTCRFVPR